MDLADIWSVIKTLGGISVVVGAIIGAAKFFAKQIIENSLSKNLAKYKSELDKEKEAFKNELETESKLEIQKASHDLQINSLEYKQSKTLLVEKRLEIIGELYSFLVNLLNSTNSFIQTGNEENTDFNKNYFVFKKFYNTKKIYFPEKLCREIEELIFQAIEPADRLRFWRTTEELSGRPSDKTGEAWREALNALTEVVPGLMDKIEAEFRSLLGVTNPSKPKEENN